MPAYQHVTVPSAGQKITVNRDFTLNVPDQPIIPYIEGDGTGVDITPVMIKVVDAAVAKAYGGARKVHWMEIYAGEKSTKVYGSDVWLPDETLAILKEYAVSIKGPQSDVTVEIFYARDAARTKNSASGSQSTRQRWCRRRFRPGRAGLRSLCAPDFCRR